MKNFYLSLLLLLIASTTHAQDIFFMEPQQIRGYFNPALTGLQGSLAFRMVGKDQFITRNDFVTAGISVEQSFPCNNMDAGVYYIYDREGDGELSTNHAGGSFVFAVPFHAFQLFHNIRIGTKIQYTYKSIDWDRLIFSDQIDPKYNLSNALGTTNGTAFTPPEWNGASQLTLGLGLIHKVDIGGLGDAWSLTWGGSIENYTSIFESSKYDSILKLESKKNRFIDKWSLYLAPEIPLSDSYHDYIAIRPSIVWLQEGILSNVQVGADFNYRRAYGAGIYLSSGSFKAFQQDTKSLMFNTYAKVFQNNSGQMNVGFQYIHNIGGVSQTFGQTIQVSLSYIFKRDGCGNLSHSTENCPQTSKRENVLYENIWFK